MASAQNMDDTAARRSEKPRGRNVSNIIREFGQVDRPFMIIVILLVSVGSILVFSASYANAESRFGDSYYFVKSQIKYILVGLPAMVITARFADTRLLKRYAWAIFGLALVLCYAIRLVPGIGIESHGAYRWINLYFFQFQPSELLKLSIILVCARYISDNQGRMRTMKYGFLPFAVIAIPVVGCDAAAKASVRNYNLLLDIVFHDVCRRNASDIAYITVRGRRIGGGYTLYCL